MLRIKCRCWQSMGVQSWTVYRPYIIVLYVPPGYAHFRVERKCQSGFILGARTARHVRLDFASAWILFSSYSRRWDMISVFLSPNSIFSRRYPHFVRPFMISRTNVKERARIAESPGDTRESRIALWLSISFLRSAVKIALWERGKTDGTLEMIQENNVF